MASVEDVFVSSLGNAPMVFIGLGGSGAEVVARLKDQIRQQFRDSKSPVFQSFQFLCIDTATFDRLPPSATAVLDPDTEFVYIGGEVNPRSYVQTQLYSNLDAAQDLRLWIGDPPNPDILNLLPESCKGLGAERFRLVGRIFLYYHQPKVEEQLNKKFLNATSSAALIGGVGRIHAERGLRVFVVSGTCGGTGSGIFFDVLYMVNRIVHSHPEWRPEVHAVLMLPDYHINLHSVTNPRLVPYYKANGWAFFSELKYILKNPEEFNRMAMDRMRAKREAVEGRGIPRGRQPLEFVWLFDAVIPGFGTQPTSNPSDFYAYMAKAFYHQLATTFVRKEGEDSDQKGADVEARLSNVLSTMRQVDRQGVPKVFCSVGYSEIRYPSLMIYHFIRYRFGQWFLKNVALREPEVAVAKKLGEDLFQRVKNDVVADLAQGLDELIARQTGDSVPGLPSFLKPGTDDVDQAKVTADALSQVVLATRQGLIRLNSDMVKYFHGRVDELVRRFNEMIKSEVATASGGKGYRMTRAVLAELDDLLEREGAEYGKAFDQRYRPAESALDTLAQGGAGSPVDGVLKPGGVFGSAKKRREALDAFLRSVQNVFDDEAKAMRARFLRELIRHIAGDPDDHPPVLERYDPDTGVKIGDTRTTAVLDYIEDHLVTPIIRRLEELQDDYSDERFRRSQWAYEGQSVSSQYLPPIKGIEDLERLPETVDLLKDMESERGDLLKRFTEGLDLDVLFGGGETLRRRFDTFVRDLVRERYAGRIGKDILTLLANEKGRETMLVKLVPASAVPVPMGAELDHNDPDREVRLTSIGSCDIVRAKGLLPHLEAAGRCATGAEELSVIQSAFAIALYRIQSLRNIFGEYLHRDFRTNWPHITVQFHEAGPPGMEEEFDDALETFVRARAVDWALEKAKTNEERADLLKRLQVEYDSVAPRWPFRFIAMVSERDPGPSRSEAPYVFVANHFHCPPPENEWKIKERIRLLEGGQTLDLPRVYVRHDSLIKCHNTLLKKMNRAVLVELCKEYSDEALRPAVVRALQESNDPGKSPQERERQYLYYRWLERMLRIANKIVDVGGPRPKDAIII